MVACEDGWVSIGLLDDFKKASSSIFYDVDETFSKNLIFHKQYDEYSLFVDLYTG